MKGLYGRLVLWLIGPALALEAECRLRRRIDLEKISNLAAVAEALHRSVHGPELDATSCEQPEGDSAEADLYAPKDSFEHLFGRIEDRLAHSIRAGNGELQKALVGTYQLVRPGSESSFVMGLPPGLTARVRPDDGHGGRSIEILEKMVDPKS